MLTEIDYCNYDTCVMLKELGFDQYATLRTYAGKGGVWLGELPNPEPDYKEGDLIALRHAYGIPRDGIEIAAPSLYEAQKWLRKHKGVIVGLYNNFTTREFKYYISTWEEDIDIISNKYTEYEEALSDGIKEAVRLILEGKLCLD